jgi:hypothetical protein
VTSTVYLVVTVTMNRRKVEVPVVGSMAIEVMEFDQVIRLEVESARLAAPFLLLQKRRESPRHAWVFTPLYRPITPVPVIQAGFPLHFDVSNNRHARVLVECWPVFIPEVPAFAGRGVPRATDGPTPTCARVPEERPSSALLIQLVVEPMEGRRTDHRAIVMCPTSDDRVKYPDQVRLLGRLVLTDDLRQLRPVAFHRLFAWPDERCEATSPRRVVLAGSMLANLEAKKVEACFALCCFERMRDAGLLLAPLQSDVLQPCLRQVATWLDHGAVPVEDDQIVRIPDDLGLPMKLAAGLLRGPSRPGWESGSDVLFESVQGDVGQKRRQDATLRRSARRFDTHAVVENPGLEPRLYEPVQGRERLDLSEEGCLVEAVETLRDLGVQGVLGLLFNRGEDRPDGIVYGSSGAESVAVGFEPSLPLWLKYEFDEGLECPIVERGNRQRAPFVCSRLRNPHTSGGSANWQLSQLISQGIPLAGCERLGAVDPGRVLTLVVLCDATDGEQFRRPRLQEEFLASVNSAEISRLRGFVDPPCELAHRHLQLTPRDPVPFIRSRCRLAHDVFARLGSSPFRSTASPSAYPPAFPEALASDVIPSRTPCGWHLLHRIDHPRRGRTGLLRSRFEFGDGRRVGTLRRDLYGVNAGRADNRRPKVRCHVGSRVPASCAGSTSRRVHSLPVRAPIHLYLPYGRVRLPASPRAFPLRGLIASRYRGECVSTPHQGWSELHRHPTRVLRLPRVSSCSPGDQSSELKARFLINGSHSGSVVRRLQRCHSGFEGARNPR